MRTFSRLSGVTLTLLLAGAILAPPARAAFQRDLEDNQGDMTYGGNADNLPVRPSLRWVEAVAWARTMPAVQLAMRTCAGRGYEALSAHDSAFVSITPPATVVIFPYRRPGLALPPYHSGQPLLMVVTTLDHYGLPSTRVTAGVVIVDAQHNAAFTADSLPQYATSDASFDVVATGGGEGGGGERRHTVVPEWSIPNWFSEQKSGFNKFVRCLGIGTLSTCIRPLITFSRTPAGFLLEVTQPEELGFYMAFCMIAAGIGCSWSAL
jgi:hypothetical protein